MYFELFKLRNWRKRSAEVRRHNCAVLPKISDILKRTDCDRRESPEGEPRRPLVSSQSHTFFVPTQKCLGFN